MIVIVFCLLIFCSCIAGSDDALKLRDEALFMDLETKGDLSPSQAEATGRSLKSWVKEFENSDELTLKDCFRLILNNAEELHLRGEKLLETQAYERESIASLLPSANLIWSHSIDQKPQKFNGMTVSDRDTTSSMLTVSQKLFDGRSLAAVPAAKASRRIEQLTLRSERDQLLYSGAAGFYKVLGLEHDLKVLDASLTSAQEFYRVVEARRVSGEASSQDALTALAQKEEAQAQLIQTRHDLMIARSDLQRILGLNRLPKTLKDTYEVTRAPGEIPDLVEAAKRDRPDLEAARESVEFAKADRLSVLSDYFPSITADFTRYLKREGAFGQDVDWNLALNLTWNLFDSFGREARQTRALSRIRQQELSLKLLEKRVRHEVEEAVLSYLSLDRVQRALDSRADASLSALNLANAEYQANEATNLDVELARKAWQAAERDRVRAKLARKLAALKIRLVIGDVKIESPLVEGE